MGVGYLNKIWKLDQHPTSGQKPPLYLSKGQGCHCLLFLLHHLNISSFRFHHFYFWEYKNSKISTLWYSMYIIHSISYIRFFSCIKRMNEIWKCTYIMKFSNMSQTPNKDFQKDILDILENIFAGQLLYENLLILSTLCLNIDWWLWMEIDAI